MSSGDGSPHFERVGEIFERFITAEYAYFTPRGEPLCWPITPFYDRATETVSIATGVAYPRKADYAKANPKVALLFSDATSSDLIDPPHILLKANARVLDENIQANTDRYVRALHSKFPLTRAGINPITVKMLGFYLPRIWIELDEVSEEEVAKPAPARTPAPEELPKSSVDGAAGRLALLAREFPTAVACVAGEDGYPSMRRTVVTPDDRVTVLSNSPGDGAACLTFHRHSLGGLRFHAYMARGRIEGERFTVRRIVEFFGNGAMFPLSLVPEIPKLRRRLARELERRGQPMPTLRVPG